MLTGFILKEAAKESIKVAAHQIGKRLGEPWRSPISSLEVTRGDVEGHLARHLGWVENWSAQISMRDLPQSRELAEVFVPLQIGLGRMPAPKLLGPAHLLSTRLNAVVLGHPGAGKTTTIKHLCQVLLHEPPEQAHNCEYPLVVRLRDLAPEHGGLVDHLLSLIGTRVSLKLNDAEKGSDERNRQQREQQEAEAFQSASRLKQHVLAEYLDHTRALVLLDGLDELHPDLYKTVTSEVGVLANLLRSARFVLTCRIGALDVVFDNTEQLYIRALDERQISAFIERWFSDPTKASRFLAAVKASPFADTIGRPLVLVNLCLVYQAYGELPEPPILIYQRIVQLYLEDWDRQRDITRVSAYGRFGPERKRQFLAALAYELITTKQTTSFSAFNLEAAYRLLHARFGLPLEDRGKVLAEIESHTGLLIQSALGLWEFSHKSIQEFLCADYISRLPSLEDQMPQLLRLPNECAIATVASAEPGRFMALLAFRSKSDSQGVADERESVGRFWNPFLTRLMIEGAGFELSIETGLAFLLLSSFGFSVDRNTRPEIAMFRDLLGQLYAVSNVRESIAELTEVFYAEAIEKDAVHLRVRQARLSKLPHGGPSVLSARREFVEPLLSRFEAYGGV